MSIAFSLGVLALGARHANRFQKEMLQCNEAFTYECLEARMSKRLTLSATLSVLAMAGLALGTALSGPERGGSADRSATEYGLLIQVLVRT